MPGIYVRAFGPNDWMQEKTSSMLTVPGSFWCCHKNNIYKFIIRYHRSNRNVQEFVYDKELMKITRRIIKCQPRQGQQLSTQHLLVTYNHTSWTRRDKMFAMLKFKERSQASVFSHAFILTVKLISSRETDTFPSQSKANDKKLHESSILGHNGNDDAFYGSSSQVLPNKAIADYTAQKSQTSIECRPNEVQITSIGTNLRRTISTIDGITFIRDNPDRLHGESIFMSSSAKKYDPKLDTQINNLVLERTAVQSTQKKVEHIEKSDILLAYAERNGGSNAMRKETTIATCYYTEDTSSSDVISLTSTNQEGNRMSTCEINYEASLKHEKNNFVQKTETKREASTVTADDSNIDSVNLPYQYFIEKEIEETKQNACTSSVTFNRHSQELGPNSDAKEPVDHETSHCGSNVTQDNEEIKQLKPKSVNGSDKKFVFNNKAHRSSDITDLVMEGLMFTIREERNTVAVIEQKTKLEVDEVLENSEKVETKEGEKCLKNSSLLGLENLITMIELPRQAVEKYQINNSKKLESFFNDRLYVNNDLGLEKTLLSNHHSVANLQYPFNNGTSQASTSFAYAFSSVSTVNRNCETIDTENSAVTHNYTSTNIESDEAEEQENGEGEEDEDIIPEALQSDAIRFTKNELFENARVPKVVDLDRDLLMDDIEMDELKQDVTDPEYNLCRRQISPTNNEIERPRNRPRVISNEIITVDQMPKALQIALQAKFLKRKEQSENKLEPVKRICDHVKARSSPRNILNTQSVLENLTLEIGNRSESLTAKNPPTNGNTVKDTQHATSTKLEGEVERDDKCHDILNDRHKEIKDQKVSIQELKRLAPNGLQDITESFYRDLMQMQKRNDGKEHRRLRQRKRPTGAAATKNEEIRVEIFKFIRDITMGAKVVVQRMSTKTISNMIGKNSSVASCLS